MANTEYDSKMSLAWKRFIRSEKAAGAASASKIAAPSGAFSVAGGSADRAKLYEIAARLQSWGESDEEVNWAYGFESLATSLREEAESIRQYLTKPNTEVTNAPSLVPPVKSKP